MNINPIQLRDSLPEDSPILAHTKAQFSALHPTLDSFMADKSYFVRISTDDEQFNVMLSSRLPDNSRFLSFEQCDEPDIVDALAKAVEAFQKQFECEHEWGRALDVNGNKLNNGDGQCLHCNLKKKKVLTPSERDNKQRYFNTDGLSGEREVAIATCPWPVHASLQGGNYQYGRGGWFFEAFPTIDGVGTYLRGDAETQVEAETAAFTDYQRMTACSAHQWSRKVNGRYREDGYGICTECGLTGTVLPPITQCSVCEVTTSNQVGNTLLCVKHMLALSEDEYVSLARDRDSFFPFDEAHNRFCYRLKTMVGTTIGASLLEKDEHAFFSTLLVRASNLCVEVYNKDVPGGDVDGIDDKVVDHPTTIDMLYRIQKELPLIYKAHEAADA